jgi:hypothetical protein
MLNPCVKLQIINGCIFHNAPIDRLILGFWSLAPRIPQGLSRGLEKVKNIGYSKDARKWARRHGSLSDK